MIIGYFSKNDYKYPGYTLTSYCETFVFKIAAYQFGMPQYSFYGKDWLHVNEPLPDRLGCAATSAYLLWFYSYMVGVRV